MSCLPAALLILLITGTLRVVAQPAIGTATLPTIGQQYVKVGYDTSSINPGPGGADVDWDFTQLMMRTDSVLVRVVGPTEFTAKQKSSFPTAQLAVIEDTTFRPYIKTPTFLRQQGVETPAVTTIVATTNPFDTRPADITFNKPHNDTYNAVTTVVGIPVPLQETGSTNLIYDGYGTLRLRGDVFSNVGRVSSQVSVTDTLKIPGPTPSTFVIRTVTLSATWYESTSSTPVLTLGSVSRAVTKDGETIEGPTATRFAYGRRTTSGPTSVAEVSSTGRDVAPNPAQAGSFVVLPLQGGEIVSVTMIDVVGNQTEVRSSALTMQEQGVTMLLPSVAPGVYSIVVASATRTWQYRCIVQ